MVSPEYMNEAINVFEAFAAEGDAEAFTHTITLGG